MFYANYKSQTKSGKTGGKYMTLNLMLIYDLKKSNIKFI